MTISAEWKLESISKTVTPVSFRLVSRVRGHTTVEL